MERRRALGALWREGVKYMAAVAAGITVLAGCSRPAQGDEARASLSAEVRDSLQRGNMEWVSMRLDSASQQARRDGDRGLWATATTLRGVRDFYAGNADGLKANADSAIRWLEEADPTPANLRDLGKAYQVMAVYYSQFRYNPDSAMHFQRLGIRACERNRDELGERLFAYSNYADQLRQAGRPDSAALYYRMAVHLADSIDKPEEECVTLYNGIAGIFTDLRDFEQSGRWWARSLAVVDRGMPHERFATLSGYGNDCYYRRDYRECNDVFLRLRRYLDSVPGARWERMFTDVNLADSYLRLGDADRAAALLDSTEAYFTVEQPFAVCQSYIHSLRLREMALRGQTGRGMAYMRTHPYSDTIRLEQRLARLEAMADFQAAAGDWQRAFKSRERYDALIDSLRSERMRSEISVLTAQFDRDSRLLELRADNSRKTARILRLLMIVGFSIAGFLGLVIIGAVSRRGHRRREQQMLDKIVALRQENLRTRITPHFIYNALNHDIAAGKGIAPERLHAIVNLLRRQQYIEAEMTVPLADELAFVRDYITVEEVNVRGAFHWSVDIDPAIDPAKVSVPSMCLQILVENAFKHGFPSQQADAPKALVIRIVPGADTGVVVRVFNTGEMPEAGNRRSGLGLRIIMETLKIINTRKSVKDTITLRGDVTDHIDIEGHLTGLTGCLATLTIH